MLTALFLGLSYGFTAGISPGPLLGLTITQTLQRGWRAGVAIALAPLLTDLPIILLALVLVQRLPPTAFGWLGIIGGLFVFYLGVDTLRSTRVGHGTHVTVPGEAAQVSSPSDTTRAALRRGAITNVLNPHPYLFWGTVGAQVIVRSAASSGIAGAAGFLVGFYLLLVGSKLVVALLVNGSRQWLRGRAYRRLLIASGVLLLVLGSLLMRDGFLLLK